MPDDDMYDTDLKQGTVEGSVLPWVVPPPRPAGSDLCTAVREPSQSAVRVGHCSPRSLQIRWMGRGILFL